MPGWKSKPSRDNFAMDGKRLVFSGKCLIGLDSTAGTIMQYIRKNPDIPRQELILYGSPIVAKLNPRAICLILRAASNKVANAAKYESRVCAALKNIMS
jgi:hypothetical protein